MPVLATAFSKLWVLLLGPNLKTCRQISPLAHFFRKNICDLLFRLNDRSPIKGPGAYDVRKASRQCLKSAPVVAFGGSLNKVDRQKTGPLKVLGDKDFVPGPCSYAVEAEEQVTTAAFRAHQRGRQN